MRSPMMSTVERADPLCLLACKEEVCAHLPMTLPACVWQTSRRTMADGGAAPGCASGGGLSDMLACKACNALCSPNACTAVNDLVD